jgi:hypothetical protein
MTKEIIAKYIAEYAGTDLASDLYAFLHQVNGIKQERYRLDQERRRLEEDYVTAKNSWKIKLNTLQSRCPHPETVFHDDPAGGNDSYYQCQYCGKVL